MSGFGTSGFSFGNTPTTAANTQPTTATGFSFGKTTALPTGNLAQPAASFGFGNLATAAPSATPSLGAPTNFNFPAATTTQTLSFGATPVSTAAAPTATTTTAFSFGTTPTLSLGGIATSTGGTAPTLGGTSFSFGKTTAAATTSASLNFSTTTTTTTGLGGLGFAPAPTAATSSTTASTPFIGLGGVDNTSSQPKIGDSKQDNVKIKETQVPDEIGKTVDALKEHIKKQKSISSDIGRTSTSKLSNVTGEILNLQWLLREISNSVETNYHQIKRLRKETSKTIQTVEMAQRTQDTPAGLQYENTGPFQFFQNLVEKYESDLINFRQQITLTEKHMQSLTAPRIVTPDDLKRGFQQINESFISLAGRLHEIHQKVESQKEQYLNLRKYRLHDTTNIFAKLDDSETETKPQSKVTSGPTPFSCISGMNTYGMTFSTTTGSGSGGNQTGK